MPIPSFTRRQAAATVAGLPLLLATRHAAHAQASDPQLAQLADTYQQRLHDLFPLDATENTGDPAYEAKLEIEIAPEHRARQRVLYESTRAALRRIDPAKLNADDRTTWQLLDHDLGQRLSLLAYPMHLLPLSQIDLLPARLAQWASGQGSQPLKTTANFDNFLARLRRITPWVEQAIANMEQGLAQRVTLPRPLVERTLPQLEALLPQDPYQSPFLAGVREMPPSIPEADRQRIAAQYRVVVFDEVNHALRRLRSFLAGQYLPQARTTSGLGALPGGRPWYRTLVRSYTTTDMSPAQVHALGVREVARIRGEMELVKRALGAGGTLNAFLKSLPTRAELHPFKSEEEVLAAYKAIDAKVRAGLPRLFERAPRAALDIRAVEPVRRDTASDHYVPPSTDGSRPGVFFVVVTDSAKYYSARMAALFLHEGQPGHHYQIAMQQELRVPKFRQALWHEAFGEGWALYAEGLGDELGVFDSPVARLGRLQMELHRALRLVVDTGLHDLGWTRERAMAYMLEQEGADEDDARRAIERYMAWPGQALAYKVGELKLLQLRDVARKRLGARFDIRQFHAQVLGAGSMPLSMLEQRIERWLRAS
ncbi:DUF885 domain-containing protein [Ramlibacter albus]|uniref:DUF885 domain-containing protein n=1 Tax=Ramlibacter albus TaxID=2079448 RepID=A0A923M9G0_9BURK|nr:DUF885 domain-containing protein [Ramlibacter albus]MBC5765209.1 DUF885 domain-containing protein [Ramlibacter albus]